VTGIRPNIIAVVFDFIPVAYQEQGGKNPDLNII